MGSKAFGSALLNNKAGRWLWENKPGEGEREGKKGKGNGVCLFSDMSNNGEY